MTISMESLTEKLAAAETLASDAMKARDAVRGMLTQANEQVASLGALNQELAKRLTICMREQESAWNLVAVLRKDNLFLSKQCAQIAAALEWIRKDHASDMDPVEDEKWLRQEGFESLADAFYGNDISGILDKRDADIKHQIEEVTNQRDALGDIIAKAHEELQRLRKRIPPTATVSHHVIGHIVDDILALNGQQYLEARDFRQQAIGAAKELLDRARHMRAIADTHMKSGRCMLSAWLVVEAENLEDRAKLVVVDT